MVAAFRGPRRGLVAARVVLAKGTANSSLALILVCSFWTVAAQQNIRTLALDPTGAPSRGKRAQFPCYQRGLLRRLQGKTRTRNCCRRCGSKEKLTQGVFPAPAGGCSLKLPKLQTQRLVNSCERATRTPRAKQGARVSWAPRADRPRRLSFFFLQALSPPLLSSSFAFRLSSFLCSLVLYSFFLPFFLSSFLSFFLSSCLPFSLSSFPDLSRSLKGSPGLQLGILERVPVTLGWAAPGH